LISKVIVKGWSYKYGLRLHNTQLRLLIKGLNLLKENGTLVYSTCSMNPLEDESVLLIVFNELKVVNAALNLMGDSVELVDISKNFGDFKIAPGISSCSFL
jgi:multisite-specific tRNA:(cytosine-C5)-methyltransferase